MVMDFGPDSTSGRPELRARVRAWLALGQVSELADSATGAEGEQARLELRRALGRQGWLLPACPREWGGAGLEPADERAIAEELWQHGVAVAVERGPRVLAEALELWGSDAQLASWLRPVAAGEATVAIAWGDITGGLHPDAGDVAAIGGAGGYVLEGTSEVEEGGPDPDLFLLPVTTDGAELQRTRGLFIVPAGLDGIVLEPLDGIVPERAPKRVTFRNVPVTRLSLIGPETRRWRELLYYLVGRSRLRMPDVAGALVDLLWSHAKNQTHGDGVLLDDDVIAELLGDALVDARIGSAFRRRNEWAIATQRRLTYELAQEARWAKRSAARLAAIGRQVLGAHALLAAEDRRAPLDGRWEAFERQVLADANPAGGPEIDAETYARELGVPLAGDERLRQTAEPGPIAARSTA